MRIVGIIAEYNPFHQGHAYQIKKVRELTQADFILVSMSGNFVQRGAPAMFGKYIQCPMQPSVRALVWCWSFLSPSPPEAQKPLPEAASDCFMIQVLSLICALEASVEICLLLSGWLHFSLRNQQTISCICKMA